MLLPASSRCRLPVYHYNYEIAIRGHQQRDQQIDLLHQTPTNLNIINRKPNNSLKLMLSIRTNYFYLSAAVTLFCNLIVKYDVY